MKLCWFCLVENLNRSKKKNHRGRTIDTYLQQGHDIILSNNVRRYSNTERKTDAIMLLEEVAVYATLSNSLFLL